MCVVYQVVSLYYSEPSEIVELKKEVERARTQLARISHQVKVAFQLIVFSALTGNGYLIVCMCAKMAWSFLFFKFLFIYLFIFIFYCWR